MREIIKEEGVKLLTNRPLLISEIYKTFSAPLELSAYNYTIIGTRKETPLRAPGGIKESASYTLLYNGQREEAVIKYFNYIYTDPDPAAVGVWIEHIFKDVDGGEGLSKVEFKPLSIGDVATLRRGQRSYAISRLNDIGVIMPELAGDMETLRVHYEEEINLFERYGTPDFYNAVINEADPAIITILNKGVTWEGVSYTVKDAILNQLTPHL